jgi:ABC-type dipeptide/oligopeptide/nickel transport system permease subunit
MGWIVLIISLVALVSVLSWGVVTMGIGGEYNSKWSNKIMRYRVILQAIALLIFVIILSFSSGD